jgi:hypothetical protein
MVYKDLSDRKDQEVKKVNLDNKALKVKRALKVSLVRKVLKVKKVIAANKALQVETLFAKP